MKDKAKFRYNNGRLALICSKCSIIIKTGKDFTKDEKKACFDEVHLKPQYREKCKE